MSSVAIVCECDYDDDLLSESVFLVGSSCSWSYFDPRHCKFVLLSALSGSYNVTWLHLIAVVASQA